MAALSPALSPASKRALSNLRAFVPPKTNYYQCPLKRRAAVLILLFADKVGDLRVVLTIRSAGLKNCKLYLAFSDTGECRRAGIETMPTNIMLRTMSNVPGLSPFEGQRCIRLTHQFTDAGQAALPGGKADTLQVCGTDAIINTPSIGLLTVTLRKLHGLRHVERPSRRSAYP
jgi:hypothetical protein